MVKTLKVYDYSDYVFFQTDSSIPCNIQILVAMEGFKGEGNICISYLKDEVLKKIDDLKAGKIKSVFIKDQDSVNYYLQIRNSLENKDKYEVIGIIGNFVNLSLKFSILITLDELSTLQDMIKII